MNLHKYNVYIYILLDLINYKTKASTLAPLPNQPQNICMFIYVYIHKNTHIKYTPIIIEFVYICITANEYIYIYI